MKGEDDGKIFDMLLSDPETYVIEELLDVKFYLKNVDAKNIDFIKNKLTPKLEAHKDTIKIISSDYYADLMHYMRPKTLESIDMVLPYAKEYDKDTIHIINLLCGVTENNIKNLPKFLKELPALKVECEKTTGVWDEMFIPKEVTAILDRWDKTLTSKEVTEICNQICGWN